jgi:membrane protease YdiL (CAAX protease family)
MEHIMESLIARLDAWVTSLVFAVAMLVFWSIGWQRGRRLPAVTGEDPGIKFTDASMALLGLLLAFTFSMALGRHDQRRLAAVAESNAIGDFYTCASLLKEPSRSRLQAVLRDYARHNLAMTRASALDTDQEQAVQRCQEMQARMTEIVADALADGTAIANPLTNTLNNVTSSNASHRAANQETLPWIIVILLLLGSVIPAFLMGLKQGASQRANLSGTFSFVILVSLVILVILDLNQPARGLIKVNYESLERQTKSMAK